MLLSSSKVARCVRTMRTSYRCLSSKDEATTSALIFGSNTGVGKTIISTGLSIAAMRAERRVCYIKPIQTGDMDEYFVQLYTNPKGIKDIQFRTLRLWKAGVSGPEDQSIGNDDDIISEVICTMQSFHEEEIASGKTPMESELKLPFSVVETLGGVLSPGPNKSLQAEVFRPLNKLPVVLVGDAGLGGISGTLCALEALQRRGYAVKALVFIDKVNSQVLRNASHVQEQLVRGFLESIPISRSHNDAEGTSERQSDTIPAIITLSPLPKNSSNLLNIWFKANESGFSALFQAVIKR